MFKNWDAVSYVDRSGPVALTGDPDAWKPTRVADAFQRLRLRRSTRRAYGVLRPTCIRRRK